MGSALTRKSTSSLVCFTAKSSVLPPATTWLPTSTLSAPSTTCPTRPSTTTATGTTPTLRPRTTSSTSGPTALKPKPRRLPARPDPRKAVTRTLTRTTTPTRTSTLTSARAPPTGREKKASTSMTTSKYKTSLQRDIETWCDATSHVFLFSCTESCLVS